MKKILRDLRDALKQLEGVTRSGNITDFSAQKQRAAKMMLRGALRRLKTASNVNSGAYVLTTKMQSASLNELPMLVDQLALLIASELDEPRDLTNIGDISSVVSRPNVPKEIRSEVFADIDEMEKCMRAKCHRSAIILCGRILECALHRKYFDSTGQDLLEKAPGMGLGNLIARLASKGVKLDPGLPNQIHLINQVRIVSVHKKKDLFMPSEKQTQAIVLYTMDIVARLFK